MQIDVKLSVDTEHFGQENRVATGWVELEYAIKFPISIRQYTDESGKQKMFVSYPQTKSKGGYSYICYPHDKEVKEQINQAIMEELKKVLLEKTMRQVPVDHVRITRFPETDTKSRVKNLGAASIQLAGITINGIIIKEGQRGRFIQMPQHLSGGEYHDTVYGMNKDMQQLIRDAVLEEYEKLEALPQQTVQKKPQEASPVAKEAQSHEAEHPQENPVHVEEIKNPVEEFVNAAMAEDTERMSEILSRNSARLTITEERFCPDGKTLAYQEAVLAGADRNVTVVFGSDYDPANAGNPQKMNIEIFAFVPIDGEVKIKTIRAVTAENSKEARMGYEKLRAEWGNITGNRMKQENRLPVRPNARMTQPKM